MTIIAQYRTTVYSNGSIKQTLIKNQPARQKNGRFIGKTTEGAPLKAETPKTKNGFVRCLALIKVI